MSTSAFGVEHDEAVSKAMCTCSKCGNTHEAKEKEVSKRYVSPESRKKLAAKKQALPGGGFPIANRKDLMNARHAVGRAKNPAAARALIERRAKQLGVSLEGSAFSKSQKSRKQMNELGQAGATGVGILGSAATGWHAGQSIGYKLGSRSTRRLTEAHLNFANNPLQSPVARTQNLMLGAKGKMSLAHANQLSRVSRNKALKWAPVAIGGLAGSVALKNSANKRRNTNG